MRTIEKRKPSKLDPFAEQLLKMDDEKKPLVEMEQWVKEQGVQASTALISQHLKKLRTQRQKRELFADIVNGSHLGREAEEAFKQNPAPALETVVKIFKLLIMQLATNGNADPDMLKLANQLMKTAVIYFAEQTKAKLENRKLGLQERRVTLLEKKAAQADATDKVLTDAQLSPEERAQRIKEIYGRV